jgi:hypothetical protein
MIKKWSFAFLVVTLMAAVFFGQASAAPASAESAAAGIDQAVIDRPANRYAGEITSVGAQGLTLETLRGDLSVLVSGETQYRSFEGPIGFEDLEAGQTIGVYGKNQPDGSLLAKTILLMPAGFDLERFRARSVRGEIWSTDLNASSFELRARGALLVFNVTEETIFNSPDGLVQSLADLQVHQRVLVVGKRGESGELIAVRIITGRGPITRHPGVIASFDLAENTLTLDRRDGKTITFALAEEIRIKSENPDINELADLSPGMRVTVVSRGYLNDLPMAILIYVPAEDTL